MLCKMKTCSKPLLILLKVIYITSLPVLEAQQVKVLPEVTGYLGQDVTLPCHFIPGPEAKIVQSQWDLKPPEGEKSVIVVYNDVSGVNTFETFLKERVEIAEQSLIIKDVEIRDAGSYTCSITTYPSGSFEGTTNLVVQEQMPLSSGVVSAIVIAAVLLLVIMAAIAYCIFIRRPHSLARHRVYIDTAGRVMDVARPSVIVHVSEEDVVYSDVKIKPSTDATTSSKEKQTEVTCAEDVTYSEVITIRLQPK